MLVFNEYKEINTFPFYGSDDTHTVKTRRRAQRILSPHVWGCWTLFFLFNQKQKVFKRFKGTIFTLQAFTHKKFTMFPITSLKQPHQLQYNTHTAAVRGVCRDRIQSATRQKKSYAFITFESGLCSSKSVVTRVGDYFKFPSVLCTNTMESC